MKFREGLLTGPPGTGTSAAVDLLLSKIEIFPSERRTPLFLLPVKASFKCLTVVNLEAAPKYTGNKVDIMRRVKCISASFNASQGSALYWTGYS